MNHWIIFLLLLFMKFFPLCARPKEANDFVLCTWNIGHFSNGSNPNSLIDQNNYEEFLHQYKAFIYEEICPDIMCINEYNYLFCREGNGDNYATSSLLFGDYKANVVGPQYNPICNAVFSNFRIIYHRIRFFDSLMDLGRDLGLRLNRNYSIETDLSVNGKIIKLVCFHLAFSSKHPELLQSCQIQELINNYKETEYVILCGDWNTGRYSLLKEAGYVLANDGAFKTFPSKGYILDNIAVKGLSITDVHMIETKLSDHNPLICRISINN